VNVAVVAPAATVTLAGTDAADVALLDSVTVLCAAVPAAGAFNVTVATAFATSPRTGAGFRDNKVNPGYGVTVRTALCVPPLSVALIFAVLTAATV
jgi:hypothetical protein